MAIQKEEIVTEAYRGVMQEAALNEFLGFFQNKAQKFRAQAQNVAYYVSPVRDPGQHVYRNPKLFPGEVYLDHTRLPKQKWSLFRSKSPVPTRGGIFNKPFNLIFIMGYSLDVETTVFYEIWFDSYSSSYIILDKYAIPVSSQLPTLDEAVAQFVDVISEERPTLDVNKDLTQQERSVLSRLARRGVIPNEAQEQAEETRLVEQLLEATTVTRHVLTQDVNSEVTEYHQTKMNQFDKRKFLQFLGKPTIYPSHYISHGFRGVVQKFLGQERAATFVIGFSLRNQIFVEIWYVRTHSTGVGSYYVFDLTSGEIVASNIKNVRQAYVAAGKKLLVPDQFVSRIE